jgi:hypothetical protein
MLYAMKHYDNPQCQTVEEFDQDLKKFLYLKKLLSRYSRDNELKERLILNHIIIIYNLFNEAATNMLFFKIDEEYWPMLITFLTYLERMPETVPNYSIVASEIPLDQNIIDRLRKI